MKKNDSFPTLRTTMHKEKQLPIHTVKNLLPHETPYSIVLVGLSHIAKAVGAGPFSIKKWIKEEQFPAKKCSDGVYRADPEAVRLWFRTTK